MWNEIGSNNDELTSSGLSHALGRAEELYFLNTAHHLG